MSGRDFLEASALCRRGTLELRRTQPNVTAWTAEAGGAGQRPDAQTKPARVGLTIERARGVADSWLFAKGASSVRIMRTGTLSLAVCGPGRVRRFLSFVSDAEFASFLHDTEYALVSTGFRFRGYAADRRRQAERRTTMRSGGERRSPAP
jgi:hypothetical protein